MSSELLSCHLLLLHKAKKVLLGDSLPTRLVFDYDFFFFFCCYSSSGKEQLTFAFPHCLNALRLQNLSLWATWFLMSWYIFPLYFWYNFLSKLFRSHMKSFPLRLISFHSSFIQGGSLTLHILTALSKVNIHFLLTKPSPLRSWIFYYFFFFPTPEVPQINSSFKDYHAGLLKLHKNNLLNCSCHFLMRLVFPQPVSLISDFIHPQKLTNVHLIFRKKG